MWEFVQARFAHLGKAAPDLHLRASSHRRVQSILVAAGDQAGGNVKIHASRRTWSPAILVAAFVVLAGLAVCLPAAALAHHDDEAPAPFHGRMPDQPDVRHVGKKTYRYLPGREEYEVTQPGKPPSFLHLDYVPKAGEASGAVVRDEGPAIPLPPYELDPVCRTSGPRIVVVYSHRPSDGTATPTATLRSIVKRMNWKFSDQSSQSSAGKRVVKMAVDCSAGQINVYNVAAASNYFGTLTATVASSLFGEPTGENAVKYLIFDHSGNEENPAVVGLGGLKVDGDKSHFNDNAFFTASAAVYNTGAVWESHVPIHELTHALGGSQTDAPHASPGHHCGDGLDSLCYADGTIAYFRDYCPYYEGYETPTTVPIDCGKDTYFNAAPEVGSWLAENWDLAGREDWFLVAPPTATTSEFVSELKGKSATLHGTVNPEGTQTSYFFEYGKTTSYGSKTETILMPGEGFGSGANGGNTAVQKEVYELAPATTYHFRIVAVNRDGVTVPGQDKTFMTTNPLAPAATTRDPAGVSLTEATLQGTINPGGAETFFQFEYGTDTGYGKFAPTSTAYAGAGTSNVSVTPKVTGLQANTIYHVRLKAWNEMGTTYGKDIWFNTGTNEWGMEPTPEPVESDDSRFQAISCPTSEACTAVGRYFPTGSSWYVPLAKVKSEGAWSLTSTPKPAESTASWLNDVSCTAANACTAVGFGLYGSPSKTLAERWDGSKWTIQSTPNAPEGSSKLTGVSCAASNDCMAVGYSTATGAIVSALSQHWNGTTWSTVTIPNAGGFTKSYISDVSCVSASDCWAVGQATNKALSEAALAEHWDGTKWTVNSPAGVPAGLESITCISSNLCFATTATNGSMTLVRWNGSTWSQETLSLPETGTFGSLKGVSCVTAKDCTAVGAWGTTRQKPLAERWNGTVWSVQSAPEPTEGSPEEAYFQGVSCVSVKCTAVGFYRYKGLPPRTLVESSTAPTWSIQATPEPVESDDSRFQAISCPTSEACTAVGRYFPTGSSWYVPLAKVKSEGAWSLTSTPKPAESTASWLNDVSCTAANACTAVGFGLYGSPSKTLAERWDGSKWTIQSTPNAPEGSSKLTGVSCAASNDCMAVGYSTATGAIVSALSQHWNGTTWSTVTIPNAGGFTKSYISDVSCVSASDCWAVGQATNKALSEAALAEHWDGTKWTVNSPAGVPAGLESITCISSNLCFATTATNGSMTLVRWNGSTWSQETLSLPETGTFGSLKGVSCVTAKDCTAVGAWGTTRQKPLAERWNGTVWSVQSAPEPTEGSPEEAYFQGVSCVSVKCTAVGFYRYKGLPPRTLVEIRQ